MRRFTSGFCSVVVGIGSLFAASAAQAQCTDAWVTKAVQEIRRELKLPEQVSGSGNSGECAISRYGNGSWSGYGDLVTKVRRSYICQDPWIGQVVGELNRMVQITGGDGQLRQTDVIGSAIAGECNPKLYGNGSWSSYADLKSKAAAYWNNNKMFECRDPWVTQAVTAAKARMGWGDKQVKGWGEVGECNMYLYNGGNWGSQADLNEKVYQTLKAISDQGLIVLMDGAFMHTGSRKTFPANSVLIYDNTGRVLAKPDTRVIQASTILTSAAKEALISKGTLAGIVAAGGGNIVAAGGGNIVAAGGGNIVAAGGGNIVAAGGGNIVAAGGGN